MRFNMWRTFQDPRFSPLEAARTARMLPASLNYDYQRRRRRRDSSVSTTASTYRQLPASSASSVDVDNERRLADQLSLDSGSVDTRDQLTSYPMSMLFRPLGPVPEDYWGLEDARGGYSSERDCLREAATEFGWALRLAEEALVEAFGRERDLRLRVKQLDRPQASEQCYAV